MGLESACSIPVNTNPHHPVDCKERPDRPQVLVRRREAGARRRWDWVGRLEGTRCPRPACGWLRQRADDIELELREGPQAIVVEHLERIRRLADTLGRLTCAVHVGHVASQESVEER